MLPRAQKRSAAAMAITNNKGAHFQLLTSNFQLVSPSSANPSPDSPTGVHYSTRHENVNQGTLGIKKLWPLDHSLHLHQHVIVDCHYHNRVELSGRLDVKINTF